jgi:acyl-coenzyme A thioesterase PaaI-like protein
MSELLDLYQKIGNQSYGAAIGRIAPYFSTISPEFVALRPSYCELVIPHTRSVENHLGTVHAIAMCNGAELVAGLMTDVSIPEGMRWIPMGMSVRYLAKAKGNLRVVADGGTVDWSQEVIRVPVDISDPAGKKVFEAEIEMKVSPIPG